MSDQTEKRSGWATGILSALGGALLTGLVTLGTQSSLQSRNAQLEQQLEQQKEQFQKVLQDTGAKTASEIQQANAQAEEKQHQVDAEAAADMAAQQRLLQHRKDTHTEVDNLKGQYWNISFINQCDEQATVAFHYQGLDSIWVTQGWYPIATGETLATGAQTRNSIIYWYAESANHKWSAGDDESSFEYAIANRAFIHLADDHFIGGADRNAKFHRYKINETDWTDPVISFSCPK